MQTSFLHQVKKALPGHISANRWLADLLGVDETTASRKFSGTVNLSTNELGLILNEMPALTSALIPQNSNGSYLFGEFTHFSSIDGVKPYLEKVRDIFKQVAAKNYKLCYFGRDLPLFHFFSNPTLFKYKVAMWCNDVSLNGMEKVDDNLFALAEEIYALYLQVESNEIWYRNILKNQIFQIRYYYSINKIEPNLLQRLIKEYITILNRVNEWCQKGAKSNSNFALSISDYATLNSGGLLMNNDTPLRLMSALSSVFFVSTRNRVAMENFFREFGFHQQQAISIAGGNERSRIEFFAQLQKTLNAAF